MTDVPDPVFHPSRRWRPSLIWAVPAAAALIGLGLLLQTYLDRGPTIEVRFDTAQGIEPGKTQVRFKDVEIGLVRAVRITSDRKHVLTTIDLDKSARDFAASDSRFWVVRPRLAGAAISGLETVLSGAYIGVDGGRSGQTQKSFVGLEEPPVVASDVPGHRYRLLAEDIGSLDVGSPIYYRRIRVGHVEHYALEPDGRHIMLGIFIKAPYDRFVTRDSRFWHASGVDLRVDANGLKVETQSLATILMGGIAFEDPGLSSGGEEQTAEDGTQFTLADNHADALKTPDGAPVTLVARFHQSIRGLAVGAPVDFRGVEIGQVRSLSIAYDPATKQFTAPVVVEIYPDRLKAMDPQHPFPDDGGKGVVLAELVRQGMRAQLKTGSLITGQRYIALDFYPEAPPVHFDPKLQPPELPTIPSDLEELQKQVETIMAKLANLPLDQLAGDMHRTLTALEASLKQMESLERNANSQVLPEIRDSLRDMRQTVGQLQQTMAPDAPLQQDSRAAMQNLSAVARSLKSLSDSLDKHPESLLRGKSGDK